MTSRSCLIVYPSIEGAVLNASSKISSGSFFFFSSLIALHFPRPFFSRGSPYIFPRRGDNGFADHSGTSSSSNIFSRFSSLIYLSLLSYSSRAKHRFPCGVILNRPQCKPQLSNCGQIHHGASASLIPLTPPAVSASYPSTLHLA